LNFLRGISPTGWQAVTRIGITLFVAWLLGLILGRVALVLALVLGFLAVMQLRNFLRVDRWLRRRRLEEPPDIDGAWGELIAVIDRIYRRKQHHKSQVTGLLRELRRLTTAMPEGAILLGPGHEILWFNPRAGSWLHLRRKRDFGIRVENLIRHPSFIEYLNTGLPEEGVIVFEPGDCNRWLAFNLVRTGESERQLLIVRDVSREMQLESMRKDFVANASHELRSPLTVINGYLDALAEDDKLDPAWNAPVLEMRRQAERMSLIINDLLELSKLESDHRNAQDTPVDIGGMLALLRKEVIGLEARPKKIIVTIDSDALLRGSESELHSIFSNLVTNAVKYTPRDGEIEMRWWTDADGAHISIRDTGVGIASEHIPRLTERFYRVDAGRARDMGGSGLGLAIVKHALQQHDANLTIDSTLGRGSTFTCHFPAARIVSRAEITSEIRALAVD
jgi:two-component system phosphate regulon sensor histidine kinase PhoR